MELESMHNNSNNNNNNVEIKKNQNATPKSSQGLATPELEEKRKSERREQKKGKEEEELDELWYHTAMGDGMVHNGKTLRSYECKQRTRKKRGLSSLMIS
jgi:hypothetical protein